jgi:hypothetical protein
VAVELGVRTASVAGAEVGGGEGRSVFAAAGRLLSVTDVEETAGGLGGASACGARGSCFAGEAEGLDDGVLAGVRCARPTGLLRAAVRGRDAAGAEDSCGHTQSPNASSTAPPATSTIPRPLDRRRGFGE